MSGGGTKVSRGRMGKSAVGNAGTTDPNELPRLEKQLEKVI